jgi:O-antigen ligase
VLWTLAVGEVAKRPWLGYGYGAYWLGWAGPSASIWQLLAWSPPHGHNGYLDTALDLGAPAVVLAILGVGRVLLRRLWRLRSASSPIDRWSVLFLILYLVYNCVESGLLTRNDLFWILCVAVTTGGTGRDEGPACRGTRSPVDAAPARATELVAS